MTIIFAVTIPYSVEAIAWGLVVMSACEMALNLAATQRYTKPNILQLIKTILPIAILTAAMYGVVMVAGGMAAAYGNVMTLTIKILVGVGFYALAAWAMRMQAFTETLQIAKQFLSKKQ